MISGERNGSNILSNPEQEQIHQQKISPNMSTENLPSPFQGRKQWSCDFVEYLTTQSRDILSGAYRSFLQLQQPAIERC